MPQAENRLALMLLIVLLVAVPAQYFITHFTIIRDSSGRHKAFQRLLSSAISFRNKYLSLTAWSKWCQGILDVFGGQGAGDPNGESPALEVLLHNEIRDSKKHFASSTEPRLYRPTEVTFRIGQVIRHKFWGYRAVIIGWDHKYNVPEEWLERNIPPEEMEILEGPGYAVLVDVRDRLSPQMTYVSEKEIELIDKTRVMHPNIEDYFESFEHGRHIPRPWLQWIYPED